jgi:glycolate oxidase FAD binding subunit
VKNVAGYDLPRLYTGSRGTLGLIAEVSFKVMPRPPAATLCVVPLPGADRAEAALARIMGSDLMPSCLELLNGVARRELTGLDRVERDGPLPDAPFLLAVAFEGVGAAVAWQVGALKELLADLGAVESLPEERREAFLEELREFPARPGGLIAQVNLLSSDIAAVAARCEAEAGARGMEVCMAAHAANGVIRLRLPEVSLDPARAAAFVTAARAEAIARGGSLVVTGGASEIAGHVDFWGPPPPGAPLMRGIREALDPRGTMYRGAFPEW